jgi:CBS domain-containing protein
MIVRDAMNKKVRIIKPDRSVREAAEIMSAHRIGSLVILKDHKLVGILTERNIMDHVVSKSRNSDEVKVEEVMTKEVVTISPDEDIEDAAELMTEKKIKKLPVVENGKLVGIITASDLIAFEKNMIEKLAGLMTVAPAKGVGG